MCFNLFNYLMARPCSQKMRGNLLIKHVLLRIQPIMCFFLSRSFTLFLDQPMRDKLFNPEQIFRRHNKGLRFPMPDRLLQRWHYIQMRLKLSIKLLSINIFRCLYAKLSLNHLRWRTVGPMRNKLLSITSFIRRVNIQQVRRNVSHFFEFLCRLHHIQMCNPMPYQLLCRQSNTIMQGKL